MSSAARVLRLRDTTYAVLIFFGLRVGYEGHQLMQRGRAIPTSTASIHAWAPKLPTWGSARKWLALDALVTLSLFRTTTTLENAERHGDSEDVQNMWTTEVADATVAVSQES